MLKLNYHEIITINFLTRDREAFLRRLSILSQMPDITSVSESYLKYNINTNIHILYIFIIIYL